MLLRQRDTRNCFSDIVRDDEPLSHCVEISTFLASKETSLDLFEIHSVKPLEMVDAQEVAAMIITAEIERSGDRCAS